MCVCVCMCVCVASVCVYETCVFNYYVDGLVDYSSEVSIMNSTLMLVPYNAHPCHAGMHAYAV